MSVNDGTCGWKPWPHSQIWLASMSKPARTSFEASINPVSTVPAGPDGFTIVSPERSWGGVQSASIHGPGAIMALRKPTPAKNSTPSWAPASSACRAATTAAPSSSDGLPPA